MPYHKVTWGPYRQLVRPVVDVPAGSVIMDGTDNRIPEHVLEGQISSGATDAALYEITAEEYESELVRKFYTGELLTRVEEKKAQALVVAAG